MKKSRILKKPAQGRTYSPSTETNSRKPKKEHLIYPTYYVVNWLTITLCSVNVKEIK